jgi:hypothetical protein
VVEKECVPNCGRNPVVRGVAQRRWGIAAAAGGEGGDERRVLDWRQEGLEECGNSNGVGVGLGLGCVKRGTKPETGMKHDVGVLCSATRWRCGER